MQPVLEDVFFGPGPLRVVNQEGQFRWEGSQRRVRVIFAGQTIADSSRVMRLQEYGRVPVYYFPMEDVRQEVLEASDHHTHSPSKERPATGRSAWATAWLKTPPGAI